MALKRKPPAAPTTPDAVAEQKRRAAARLGGPMETEIYHVQNLIDLGKSMQRRLMNGWHVVVVINDEISLGEQGYMVVWQKAV